MLKVRLQRVGRRNDPSFRMVVIESTKGPKSRNYIEMLGSYNPRQKAVEVNGERVKHWIAQGAQVSDTVHNILVNEKVIDAKKVNPLGKKTPIVSEKAEEEAAAEAPATEEAAPEGDAPAEEAPAAEEPKEDAESANADEVDAAASGDSDKEETPEEPKEEKKEAE